MTNLDHILTFAFAVAYPTYAYLDYLKIKPDLVANKPGIRIKEYRETSGWLWLFGLAALALWHYEDRPLSTLGLGSPSGWPAWVGLLIVVVLSLLMSLQLKKINDDQQQRQSLKEQLNKGLVAEFLPRTRKELRWFVFMSFAAGICEEILFRGYLLWYFLHFSTPVAIVISSVLFGLAHSYQGWQGVLRTAVIGLVLCLAYMLTGSLWVPIFLHVVGDIYSGGLGILAFGEEEAEPTPV